MIRDDFLTNSAYGFPTRGHVRRIDPKVLAVVHITANLAVAQNQRDYANRPASPGPSATHYIDRDGSGIHAVDERRFAAWSNGDMKSPKLANAGIAYLAKLRADGMNANEGCYLEIEGVGTATVAGQWTDAQFETVATLIADAAHATGLPISDTTVLPHAWINTVDRAHCPSLNPAAHIARLVARARELADMVPAPITDETPGVTITVADGAAWYDIDGTTILAHSSAPLGPRSSPYGTTVPVRRAMYATLGGRRRIVLVKPTTIIPPAVQDCKDEIAAAITADRAKARIVYT